MTTGNRKNVTIIITKIPENTPQNEYLYLVSNYNKWKAGLEEFAFKKNDQALYSLTVPWEWQDLEFKITHGDWFKQEVDAKGQLIENRKVKRKFVDTLFISVVKWNDIIHPNEKIINIVLSKISKKTPVSADIYIVGGFNEWDPSDKRFKLKISKAGNYTINMPERWLKMGYKFTRGSWKTVEADKFGGFVENRVYKVSGNKLYVEIDGWEDK